MSDHWSLQWISRVERRNHASIDELSRRLFGVDCTSIREFVSFNRLRCLNHIPSMLTECLSARSTCLRWTELEMMTSRTIDYSEWSRKVDFHLKRRDRPSSKSRNTNDPEKNRLESLTHMASTLSQCWGESPSGPHKGENHEKQKTKQATIAHGETCKKNFSTLHITL